MNKLSVIVPAHNEEAYIAGCLSALLAQRDHIHEIIVVDNGSTDRTGEIVAAIAATERVVRVIEEATPGVVHARNAGFEAATGEVLGRIDADTRVRPGWAQEVVEFFERPENSDVGAVTGLSNSYDSPYRRIKGWYMDRLVRKGLLGGDRRIRNLHGANMALLASTWEKVRGAASTAPDVHEDADLALCITAAGIAIAQSSAMWADVSPRRALTSPREFSRYLDAGRRTLDAHGALTEQHRRLLRLHWFTHLGAYLAYRPFDPDRGRFTLRRLIFGGPARRMPVA